MKVLTSRSSDNLYGFFYESRFFVGKKAGDKLSKIVVMLDAIDPNTGDSYVNPELIGTLHIKLFKEYKIFLFHIDMTSDWINLYYDSLVTIKEEKGLPDAQVTSLINKKPMSEEELKAAKRLMVSSKEVEEEGEENEEKETEEGSNIESEGSTEE